MKPFNVDGYSNDLNLESYQESRIESTDVLKKEDGTYEVTDAKLDNDNNIYVVDNQGKRTGEIIGVSLTPLILLSTIMVQLLKAQLLTQMIGQV